MYTKNIKIIPPLCLPNELKSTGSGRAVAVVTGCSTFFKLSLVGLRTRMNSPRMEASLLSAKVTRRESRNLRFWSLYRTKYLKMFGLLYIHSVSDDLYLFSSRYVYRKFVSYWCSKHWQSYILLEFKKFIVLISKNKSSKKVED